MPLNKQTSFQSSISWNVILVPAFEWVQDTSLLLRYFIGRMNRRKVVWSGVVFSDVTISFSHTFLSRESRHPNYTCKYGVMSLIYEHGVVFWEHTVIHFVGMQRSTWKMCAHGRKLAVVVSNQHTTWRQAVNIQTCIICSMYLPNPSATSRVWHNFYAE